MQMYRTVKVKMSEYFRFKLNQYMTVMISNITRLIHKKGNKCEAGKLPCAFLYAFECVRLCTPHLIPIMRF